MRALNTIRAVSALSARMGSIADIVEGVRYLEAAAFVTGETLHIDGGQRVAH